MISDNLHKIWNELPSGVKLVAVSKFHPASAILEAYNEGQMRFGENRPQEFAAKAVQLPQDIEWHFIGHLQTNKLKLVLPYASLVESVDSLHLLEAIESWADLNDRSIRVLLEVHIGAEETKQGFTPEEILSLLSGFGASCPPKPSRSARPHLSASCEVPPLNVPRVAVVSEGRCPEYPHIVFCGLMGMASHTDDEEQIRGDFARIKTLFDECRERFPQLTEFNELSIGMSDDWRIALDYGATIVRIGTAIFGNRY